MEVRWTGGREKRLFVRPLLGPNQHLSTRTESSVTVEEALVNIYEIMNGGTNPAKLQGLYKCTARNIILGSGKISSDKREGVIFNK